MSRFTELFFLIRYPAAPYETDTTMQGQRILVHLSLSDAYCNEILIALHSFTDVLSRISFHGHTNTPYSAQNAQDVPVMYI